MRYFVELSRLDWGKEKHRGELLSGIRRENLSLDEVHRIVRKLCSQSEAIWEMESRMDDLRRACGEGDYEIAASIVKKET